MNPSKLSQSVDTKMQDLSEMVEAINGLTSALTITNRQTVRQTVRQTAITTSTNVSNEETAGKSKWLQS